MSGPLRLRHRVLEAIRRHALWCPGDPVVVACSGGRDSMVLLDVLWATARAHGGVLSVLTVDHQHRVGTEADAAFVVAQAEARGLPVEVVRVSPTSSTEAGLRAARHAVFDARIAAGAVVALGHHRSDQAETVLLQLLRGGGVRARRGMLPSREGRVRPLLDEPVEALVGWTRVRDLAWREDPTNASLEPLRNRLRHEVLPLLERVRPGATAAFARSARLAALDEQALAAWADELQPTAASLDGVPEAVARRVVRCRWPELGAHQVDALLGALRAGNGRVVLGRGRALVVEQGVIEERALGEPLGVVTDGEPAPCRSEDSQ